MEHPFPTARIQIEISGTVGFFGNHWRCREVAPCCSHSGMLSEVSLNFVKGSGEVEGEILETLWSRLDKITGMTQAKSIVHHQEVIDEYVNHSNWRKIIQMRKYLLYVYHHTELKHFLANSSDLNSQII
jgi:hypothetical protein